LHWRNTNEESCFFCCFIIRISTFRILKSADSYFLQTFELSSPRFRVKLTRFRWQESVRPFCLLARSEGGETDTGCTHQPLSIALSLTLSAPPVFPFMLFAYVIAIPCQKMSSKETFAWQYRKLDTQMGIVFLIVAYKNLYLSALELNLFNLFY